MYNLLSTDMFKGIKINLDVLHSRVLKATAVLYSMNVITMY